jgi:murein DD-endopeptidase MepM/ murein hydrolase activator NlpD
VFVTSTIPGRGTATLTVPVASEGPIAAAVPFNVPAEGFLTREFEPDELHYGIDFAAKEGSPVWAAAPGSVIFSGWTPADGNVMMIAHSLGYVTVYKHNKALHKTTGQPVRRGEVIAAVGSTGKSTGPHLHFEVWRNGMPLDAGEYILAHQ